jgi:hypothetical protein
LARPTTHSANGDFVWPSAFFDAPASLQYTPGAASLFAVPGVRPLRRLRGRLVGGARIVVLGGASPRAAARRRAGGKCQRGGRHLDAGHELHVASLATGPPAARAGPWSCAPDSRRFAFSEADASRRKTSTCRTATPRALECPKLHRQTNIRVGGYIRPPTVAPWHVLRSPRAWKTSR